MEVTGADLMWKLSPHYGYGCRESSGLAKVISSQGNNYHAIDASAGRLELLGPEEKLETGHRRDHGSDIRVHRVDDRIVMRLEISEIEQDPRRPLPEFGELDRGIALRKADWEGFRSQQPSVREQKELAELSWYTMWSCFVRAEGSFATDACLMSKVFMSAVWSWDHCFNALALSRTRPQQAFEQFLLPFHLQAVNGALPDLFAPNA